MITWQEIQAIHQNGGGLIDVRSPQEFALGALTGAVNIPMDQLIARIDELPKDKPVLLYCLSGTRSGMAEQYLNSIGYDARNIGCYKTYAHCS